MASKEAHQGLGRRRTLVNCWSASEHQSHALWRIYFKVDMKANELS